VISGCVFIAMLLVAIKIIHKQTRKDGGGDDDDSEKGEEEEEETGAPSLR
jgi:hypothetical protein